MLVPIGIIFVGFAIHFYRTLVSHKFERSERGLQELESMISNLHNDSHNLFTDPSVRPSTVLNIWSEKNYLYFELKIVLNIFKEFIIFKSNII